MSNLGNVFFGKESEKPSEEKLVEKPCWAICCYLYRIWCNTSVWVSMKASDGIMGGGGGRSPLPDAPKPLGELRIGPII
jgi:hypothetical protein